MNKGLDERLIPDGQYRDALNIEVSASEGAGVGALENIKGNTNVSNQTFTADAKTIGAIADSANSEIYWFVADTDYDYVIKYNESTSVTTILLKDTKGTVLKFDKRYLITGVNIIDNLLFWTDDLNPPRRLNIDKVYPNSGAPNFITTFIEDDISVIVKPPINRPSIALSSSTTGNDENNLEDKFIQFACRYKYENDEYSAISPFSATAFSPSGFNYDYGDAEFDSMINQYNTVAVSFFVNGELSGGSWVPDARITDVQLLFRDTSSSNINVIETFPIDSLPSALSTSGYFSFNFNNSKIYTVLPPDEITRLFDNVPLKAKAQELIGSRIAYGNYVQFYDITDSSGAPIDIDFSLDYSPTAVVSSSPKPTFRSDRDYEAGLVYLDDYGRMTTVLTSPTNTLHIPPTASNTANNIRVTINNEAPSFAKKYRIFIKQPKGDYYNIFPLFYYRDGVFRWFRINQADVDKVKIGDYIILKANNGSPTLSDTQYKVIDVSVKEEDFLGNGEFSGLYFKIKVDSSSLFDGNDLYEYTFEGRGASGNGSATATNADGYNAVNPIKTGGTSRVNVVDIPVFYGSGNQSSLTNLVSSSSVSSENEAPYTAQDVRIKITIDGNGTPDTFKYEVFTGTNYSLISSGVSILAGGNDITAANGTLFCKLQFGATTGNKIGDYWIVNSHAGSGLNVFGQTNTAWTPSIFGRYCAIPTGLGWSNNASTEVQPGIFTADQDIKAGAIIKITITDTDGDTGNSTVSTSSFAPSPATYANIEEWFYESGSFLDFNYTSPRTGNVLDYRNVFFKRGYDYSSQVVPGPTGGTLLYQDRVRQRTSSAASPSSTSWANYLSTNAPVRMFVMGGGGWPGAFGGNDRGHIEVEFELIQQTNPNIFETTPTENDVEIYHELSDTFDIINGAHQGNDTNQVIGAQAAVVSLNSLTSNSNYNAYCFGNGVESSRIRSDFNGSTLKYSPRVSSVIEDYQQQRVEEAITYSGIYRENTGINNLNEFNLSLANFKYLDKFFGSIQKLHARDTDLVAFQEEKVSKILFGKNLLSDAVGGGAVASIPEVLGTQISYAGEYGISTEPESFATWGNDMYFTDSRHGSVMKLGANGMFEISSQGMRNYFKGLFQGNATQKIGAIDPFKERYVLASNDELSVPCNFSYKFDSPSGLLVGNLLNTRTINVAATGSWTIALQDTGDGTTWVEINGSSSTYTGHGNELVTLTFAANPGPNNRSLGINLTGCSVSYPETATQYAKAKLERVIFVVDNEVDSGLIADQKYTFTSNTTGGDIVFNDTTLLKNTVALESRYADFEGRNSIPVTGDTIELKADEAGTLTQKPFSPNLGNSLSYLVTDTQIGPDEIDTLLGSTTPTVPALAAGVYTGSFVFSRPSDEKYIYLVYDYRNNVTYGATPATVILTGSAAITSTVNCIISYTSRVGIVTLLCTPSGTNRFIVRWGDEVVADSGNVAVPTTLTFFKNKLTPSDVALEIQGGGAFTVAGGTTTLTSFVLDTNNDDASTVCARVPATTKYHSGSAALPVVGDIIYNESIGTTTYDGGSFFHKIGAGDDYVIVNNEGLVLATGDCAACSEVAVPVISTPNFSIIEGEEVVLQLQATLNPTSFAIVTTCSSYELSGGIDGAIYTTTDCDTGASVTYTVSSNSTITVCTSTAPVLNSGTGTSSLVGTCDENVMPPGLSLDKLRGQIIGTPLVTGIYTVTFTATNCFGTSVNTAITITVNPPTENKRFNMDQGNPKRSSSNACSIVAPSASYSVFYHNGKSEYPEINDFVFEYCNCQLRPFNGGYLWYVTDETSGGKNYVIRIDSVGQVVDKTLCP